MEETHLLLFAEYLQDCIIQSGPMTYPTLKIAVSVWLEANKKFLKDVQ